ncbi:hypothetical protein AgCh_022227 [Apium graveolens]
MFKLLSVDISLQCKIVETIDQLLRNIDLYLLDLDTPNNTIDLSFGARAFKLILLEPGRKAPTWKENRKKGFQNGIKTGQKSMQQSPRVDSIM